MDNDNPVDKFLSDVSDSYYLNRTKNTIDGCVYWIIIFAVVIVGGIIWLGSRVSM